MRLEDSYRVQSLSLDFKKAFCQPIMTISVREGLIQELKGKTIRVNDLGNILPGWPEGVNPDVKELRDQIEPWLDTYGPFC